MRTVHETAPPLPVLRAWPDEAAFFGEELLRRRSDEVDLGATWRAAGSADTWRLAWLRETGELYVCRNDSCTGTGSGAAVLAVVPDEAALDAMLDGWREARHAEDGLSWLARVQPAVAA